MRKNIKKLPLLFCAASVLFMSCGKAIDKAAEFKPNKAPVIETVTEVMAADGSKVDKDKVTSGLGIRINVKGYDPEGKPLTWNADSSFGSIKNRQVTPDGFSFIFMTSDVVGGEDVQINISVSDDKKASVSFPFSAGTGKIGAILTLEVTGSETISASGTTELSLTSSSSGYYEIYCDNTATEVTAM